MLGLRRASDGPSATRPGRYDCHRDHGPYAGVAEFLTLIAEEQPRLAARHEVELNAIAQGIGRATAGFARAGREQQPELVRATPGLRLATGKQPGLDPTVGHAADEQPIRFHPARRTAYLAYGASEFVAAWAQRLRRPAVVRFEHVGDADETTRELLDRLTVRIGQSPLRLELCDDGDHKPAAGLTADAAQQVLGDSLARGFYPHAERVARRARASVSPRTDLPHWWAFTTGLATALTALDRAEEALALYDEALEITDDPKITMSAGYATAMLYARHLPAAQQDPARARHLLELALRLAADLPDPRRRLLSTVFYEQGIALLDSREGDPAKALRRIDDGLDRLESTLGPGERQQDRARLRHNRAQVHLALGDPARALADLDTVIAMDPGNCEYYMDRAALHRAAGRSRAAIGDYTAAIRLGPHLPEAYYNRATLHRELGRAGRAGDDLGHALDVDPAHLDARIARVNLAFDRGDLDTAETDARAGLLHSPGDPALMCTLGLIRSERGAGREADELLSRALAAEPTLVEAWTNRAAVRFEAGDVTAAIADLDRAIALSTEPVPRYNRGMALIRLGRWEDAAHDFTSALAQPGLDRTLRRELQTELARCHAAVRHG